ncbi:SDR family oxidoreductase [Brevundimonas sp.]|uniref:SDR family oxidoreductase n=1 Tax=Brevundimonas sp. TaxID=1871086 RepID=UPI002CDCCCA9|nr:SDR family oxidoreductase [Brevundimonas sp.]HWQ85245.1 SDR family oxidoreductase [Brevundimonas sp.]
MRVLVVGANGLIGGHVVARLLAEGFRITGVGRDVTSARRRVPDVAWRSLDMASSDVGAWLIALEGVAAVVNCAGALQDNPGDDLAGVHVRGLARLTEACQIAGVRRFIQISASTIDLGTDAFSATKRAGDAVLGQTGLDWLILRPGLVLAPSVHGGSALLRGLAGFPGLLPAVHADSAIRVVSAEDLAEAVVRGLSPGAPSGQTLDLVSAEAVSLGMLLVRLRAWLGFGPVPLVDLPPPVARLSAHIADAAAWLGWRSPMRSTALGQLAGGVDGRAGDAAVLGLDLRSLEQILAVRPSSVQDRRHARTYFLSPVVLAGLSLFWLISGLVGLASQAQATAVLTVAGLSPELSRGFVLAGVGVDLALAVLVLVRRTSRWALAGMILVTLAYLAGATLWRPDLWLDPMGPLVKTLPAALLALCALALQEEK